MKINGETANLKFIKQFKMILVIFIKYNSWLYEMRMKVLKGKTGRPS
jgi:hypothetical protein